jgi:hypothetical protein
MRTGWLSACSPEGVPVDAHLLQRDWFFKSKKGYLTTFRVTVEDRRPGEREHPELECLLDLVEERDK